MQSENRFFDDFAKLMNGLAGTVAGAGREAEAQMREKAKGFFGGMDFVSREEFDAVKAMAAAARDENEALKSRIAALEAQMAGVGPADHIIDGIVLALGGDGEDQGRLAVLQAPDLQALPAVLLPYQQRLVEAVDRQQVVVVEKSRRTGFSWVAAAIAVLHAARSRDARGMDVLYMGYEKEMTREFIS